MKKLLVVSLLLCLSGTAVLSAAGVSSQGDSAIDAFWQKFKTAVANGDREAVSRLSRFPIRMSYGIRSIKNKAELRRRYRQVFSEQSNAARCFATKQPELDATNQKRFTVACPDAAGNEVVIYEFLLTKTGWKFVSLDNINE